MSNIATVLNAHQNSMSFRDTLESILFYWGENVLVVVDGVAWDQFENEKIPARVLQGLNHGHSSCPYRNMALGLMKSWEVWEDSVDWYCYMEYDCLVGSALVKDNLKLAKESGMWMLGNDFREDQRQIGLINSLAGEEADLKYLLGCCVFFNSVFIKKLVEEDVFNKILDFSNFHGNSPFFFLGKEKTVYNKVYDISEFLYPTLANFYGGKVGEFACWKNNAWTGAYNFYTMRFRPDLELNDPILYSCIMHPVKEFTNPVRTFHRGKRHLPFET